MNKKTKLFYIFSSNIQTVTSATFASNFEHFCFSFCVNLLQGSETFLILTITVPMAGWTKPSKLSTKKNTM